MSDIRRKADAILVGGNSFRTTPLPLFARPEYVPEYVEDGLPPVLNVVVSRTLDFRPSPEFLNEPRIRPLFIAPREVIPGDFPAETLACEGPITPQWIVKTLGARGVNTLLIEAGGDLLFQFLAADLVDEIYLTLCPKILGKRGAPTLADGGETLGRPFRALTLLESRVAGEEVFLHYTLRGVKSPKRG